MPEHIIKARRSKKPTRCSKTDFGLVSFETLQISWQTGGYSQPCRQPKVVPTSLKVISTALEAMGNCASFTLDYQCEKCGSTPKTNQNLASKGKWVVDNGTYCRPCFVTDKLEKEKFEKERAFYARAKTDLYPRSITNPRLKRIASNESWTSSASFKQSWRPASTIQHLVQALMHHKKSTEDVTSPRDIADFPQDEAGPSSSSSDEMCCNDNGEAVHLQALEADLDVGYVSEEDLQICDSHASADGMVEMSSGVPAGHDSFSEDDVVNDQRTNSKKENEVPEGGKKGGQALDVPQRLSSWPVLGGSRVMDSHVDG